MVQTCLLLNDSESLVLSGLGSVFTRNGYSVLLHCELGAVARTMGLRVEEGSGGNGIDVTRWLQSQAAIDGDGNEDGVIEWVEAVGSDAGSATLNGNWVRVDGLRADSFTIHGTNVDGRSVVNAIQVVASLTLGSIIYIR